MANLNQININPVSQRSSDIKVCQANVNGLLLQRFTNWTAFCY